MRGPSHACKNTWQVVVFESSSYSNKINTKTSCWDLQNTKHLHPFCMYMHCGATMMLAVHCQASSTIVATLAHFIRWLQALWWGNRATLWTAFPTVGGECELHYSSYTSHLSEYSERDTILQVWAHACNVSVRHGSDVAQQWWATGMAQHLQATLYAVSNTASCTVHLHMIK